MILAVGVFTLSSCKKDWTCTCTVTGIPFGITESIKDKKKKDAKAECDGETSLFGYTMSCAIK